MQTRILKGKEIAQEIREELRKRVDALKAQGVTPCLGVVRVGDDPASRSYVKGKRVACEDLGMQSREEALPADTPGEHILNVVKAWNRDPLVHGILVQLPLPDQAWEQTIIETIAPEKDVDGFHPINAGRLMLGLPGFIPCTPNGILHMLSRSHIPIEGAHVVILGRSRIVGRPLAQLLTQKGALGNATVTVCHTRTRDFFVHTRQADIVVAAVGRPGTLTGDMIHEGATVIDVGVNRVTDESRPRGYRLVGDAVYDEMMGRAAAITPVPGGVGPMTITMLMLNTVEAAERRTA